ncbi:GAF domain-containing protein [Frigoribacterium sp. PhB107]|uniref:GAF domain-containing protein n=1 Tax=Frigoribacterium sp. PhB107 TaxID=2485172 RepID=UPI000F49A39A|nr:GAF domain-containing protein [Frigoribacterium sp. PhB107]ROP72907.1 GAF domain-containing protein [Frigoribacterium sp. PhB107]
MTRTVDHDSTGTPGARPSTGTGTGSAVAGAHQHGYERLRPVMKLWYLWWLSRSRHVLSPRDEPTARTSARDADTVLIVGNGPAHGWGVSTHDQALVGQLSRASSEATGRPCSVDYVGDEMMSIESTRAWIRDTDLGLYDTVVVLVGLNDAVRLTPLDVWERELRLLVSTIARRSHPTARTVLVGVPPVRSAKAFDSLLGSVAEQHGERMNALTELVASEAALEYFRLPAGLRRPDSPHGCAEGYRRWAQTIAHRIAPTLDRVHQGQLDERLPRHLPQRSFEWSGGDRLVQQAATGGSDALKDLAKEAEAEFGVDVAVVSMLDGSKLWYAMNTELLPVSIPRELTFCDVTVAADDVVVVEDARKDERFADNPYLDLNHGYFYAGHPIHSSTGETIGTFCLHNTRPRKASSVSPEKLREFALRAEAELQSYEPAPAAPQPLTRRARREAEERAAAAAGAPAATFGFPV